MTPTSKQRDNARGRVRKQQQSVPGAYAVQHHSLPVEFQQAILNVFTQAFAIAQGDDLKVVIQEVKGHLFNRDFITAFSKPVYLDAYALRWSAARALAYTDIFSRSDRRVWFSSRQCPESSTEFQSLPGVALSADHTVVEHATKIVCIGGGAGAEIAALASASRHLSFTQRLDIFAIDIADWTEPVNKLGASLTTIPKLSAYASEAIRQSNRAFLDPEKLTINFLHKDILSYPQKGDTTSTDQQQQTPNQQPRNDIQTPSLQDILSNASLCTMMFTLNELFTTSIPKTTATLLSLTDAMSPGSHLLVVDSPGSYSEIKLGNKNKSKSKPGTAEAEPETKKYPMKWLLDHTLLNMAGKDKWTKIEDEESVWFRIEDKSALKYPLELENMRYQIHVYRRQ